MRLSLCEAGAGHRLHSDQSDQDRPKALAREAVNQALADHPWALRGSSPADESPEYTVPVPDIAAGDRQFRSSEICGVTDVR
jgi:hypothetical protein